MFVMKKYICLLLILSTIFPVFGCSENKKGLKFDYDDMQLTSSEIVGGNESMAPEEYATYDRVLEWIGKDGIIAAGYAKGMRESFYPYTLTEFAVTDLYRGELSGKTIKIYEEYCVYEENGQRFLRVTGHSKKRLENDIKYLVFLKPAHNGKYYKLQYRQIPLMNDYKEYNEEYLKSVLDFFRGDKTQYIAEGPWSEYDTNTAGEQIRLSHHLAFWPERKVSDEKLLNEMENHLLIRLAAEYKIAIWPYGHKNFTLCRYADKQFSRICIPSEEFFELPYVSDEFFGVTEERAAEILRK